MDSREEERFYANVCHVCRAWGKDIKLKRCANCKMIAYCNREHQKKHWPQHKELCRILTNFLKVDGTLRATLENIKCEDSPLSEGKILLMTEIGMELGRELMQFEKDMIQFPRACEICHETDFLKLRDCTDCPDASFCILHPKDSEHSVKCETSKLSYATYYKACLDWGEIFSASIAFRSDQYWRSIPNGMDQLISLLPCDRLLKGDDASTKTFASLISDVLSVPYTFLYSLEKLSRPKLSKMTIHVIDLFNVIDTTAARSWHCLLHHNLSLKELKIVFIGPFLLTYSEKLSLCAKCKKNKCKITIHSVGKSYSDFATEQLFTKPDYVIGFTLGVFGGFISGTLVPTIEVLAKLGCPFSITSHIATESNYDQEGIDLILGKRVKALWNGINPFASLRPRRDCGSNDFFYANRYLTIYEKLC